MCKYKVWQNISIYLFRHASLSPEEVAQKAQDFLQLLQDFVYGLSEEQLVFEIVEEESYIKQIAEKKKPE